MLKVSKAGLLRVWLGRSIGSSRLFCDLRCDLRDGWLYQHPEFGSVYDVKVKHF